MHEVSLGGVLIDYLTGEAVERTTYEDLRQALARFLVEERDFARHELVPRYAVAYTVAGEAHERTADIAVLSPTGEALLLVVFCPGQVATYAREVLAMARLAVPKPCPLAVVTDTREAELLAVQNGECLARGLHALPDSGSLRALAAAHAMPPLHAGQREKESRILHAYTGFLKSCCSESCRLG